MNINYFVYFLEFPWCMTKSEPLEKNEIILQTGTPENGKRRNDGLKFSCWYVPQEFHKQHVKNLKKYFLM